MKAPRTRAVWLLAALLLTTCAQKPKPLVPDSALSDDPEVEAQFRLAKEAFEQNDLQTADQRFQALINDRPDDPLARVATVYRGRIALIEKEPEQARTLLKPIVGNQDPTAERAGFYDGIALYQMGRWKAAAVRLKPFAGRMTDPGENRLLLDTLWKASLAYGNPSDAIVWLDQAILQLTDEREIETSTELLESICRKIDDLGTLKKIESRLEPEQRAWPLVMARIAELYFEAEEFTSATRILDKVKRKERNDVEAVQIVEAAIEQRSYVDLSSLGIIVPLSGRSRLIGEAMLKGAMLGAKTVSVGSTPHSALTIVIRDSAGDPELAAAAVEELVFSEHVAAILGPVNATAAEAAADQAEELGVPMLALSIKDGLANANPFVFREFGSNRSELRALVTAAIRLGNTSYGILYPNSGYGQAMRDLFADALEKHGLDLSVEAAYAEDEKAFIEVAKTLSESHFDALFIPGRASHLALVAPALAAAGLWSTPEDGDPAGPGRAVQLLLPSTGFSPDLIRRAGRYLDGALFTSFFFKDATADAQKFAQLFVAEYGTEPNYLSGFGFDAALLIAGAIASGASSREEIRHWLAHTEDPGALPLATPFAGFSESGEPLATPLVLQLREGEFRVLR